MLTFSLRKQRGAARAGALAGERAVLRGAFVWVAHHRRTAESVRGNRGTAVREQAAERASDVTERGGARCIARVRRREHICSVARETHARVRCKSKELHAGNAGKRNKSTAICVR